MDNNRRTFLKNSSLLASSFILGKQLTNAESSGKLLFKGLRFQDVPVIYTGDMHGRIHPFSYGRLNNIGGINNIISAIQKNSTSHLLVDAGDFIDKNGSFDDHIQVIQLMNITGYHAVTLGDMELSKGQDHLAALIPFMRFQLVNCNYEFSNPVLKNKVLPYHIISYGKYKIGVTGVGPDIRGKKSSECITCHSPYKKANEIAGYLKEQLGCDMVICLSHLGMEQKGGQQGNKKLAAISDSIDVIISSHNKTVAAPQMVLRNKQKNQVIIANAGYGGSIIGKLNFTFNEERKMQTFECKNFIPGALANASFYEAYKKLSA
jgi:5'-nucleotidase